LFWWTLGESVRTFDPNSSSFWARSLIDQQFSAAPPGFLREFSLSPQVDCGQFTEATNIAVASRDRVLLEKDVLPWGDVGLGRPF